MTKKPDKPPRSLSANNRRNVWPPELILIAGEDFAPTEAEAATIQDAESAMREAIDPKWLDGRRNVRHMREENERLRAANKAPKLAPVFLHERSVQGYEAFILARLLNKRGMRETDAQLVSYVARMRSAGEHDDTIRDLFDISQSQLDMLVLIGRADTDERVIPAMDSWLPLSVAAFVAGHENVRDQRRLMDEYTAQHENGKRVTVRAAKLTANATLDAANYRVPFSARETKNWLELDESSTQPSLTARERALIQLVSTGNRSPLAQVAPDLLKQIDEIR